MRTRNPRDAMVEGTGAVRRRAAAWPVVAVAWAVAPFAWAGPAGAQEAVRDAGWFPRTHHFASPLADPREPLTSAGLIVTDLFEADASERPPFSFPSWDDAAQDIQGTVGFAAHVPVWGWRGPGEAGETAGLIIGMQAGVLARFRIERPSRDMVGTDWTVAVPIELEWREATARVRLIHRSAHLGDEVAAETGAHRIEFSHEAVDALVGLPVGGGRMYLGGAWIFRSNTEAETTLRLLERGDNGTVQAGYDGTWYPWAGGQLGPVAGLDWQRSQRTAWQDELALVAGLGGLVADHTFRLVLRYYQGPSPTGQFFLTPERYWGVEFVAQL